MALSEAERLPIEHFLHTVYHNTVEYFRKKKHGSTLTGLYLPREKLDHYIDATNESSCRYLWYLANQKFVFSPHLNACAILSPQKNHSVQLQFSSCSDHQKCYWLFLQLHGWFFFYPSEPNRLYWLTKICIKKVNSQTSKTLLTLSTVTRMFHLLSLWTKPFILTHSQIGLTKRITPKR